MTVMFPSFLRPWLLASTWNHNPGNKTVRCGVVTVGLFYGPIVLGNRLPISGNVFVVGLIVVLLFALATLSFGCMSVVNYFRRRKLAAKQGLG